MLIYNPTDKPVEYRYGGMPKVILAKESLTVSKEEAKWMLDPRKAKGLVRYTEALYPEMKTTDMDYKTMPWRELIKVASARGLFRPGTKRDDVVKVMEEYDSSTGVTQKPSN